MAVNKVPGVIESSFSYEEGTGVVTFDPDLTDPEIFIAELKDKTGFVGSVRDDGSAGSASVDPSARVDPEGER